MRLASKSALVAAALSTAFAGAVIAGPAVGGTTSHAQPSIAKRVAAKPLAAQSSQTTSPFTGAKVNGGTATSGHDKDGRLTLALSDDFKVPQTPAPHWQVVDSDGNTYLLERLVIKEDKFHKQITVPRYVKDVAKVQIWCAWAEALLGEAPFASPVK